MFGDNPKRPPAKGDGSSLEVQEVFATIQGEGPYSGHPAIFIRLGGCNLACDFCDTEFESFNNVPCKALLNQVKKLALGDTKKRIFHLIVITGGEPLRQQITPLCEALLAENFKIQIESNGTLYRELPDAVEIVCSPKASDNGFYQMHPTLWSNIVALKFLVSATDARYSNIAEVGQAGRNIPIYVQPIDSHEPDSFKINMAYAAELALRHGYRLSLQQHKILGIA